MLNKVSSHDRLRRRTRARSRPAPKPPSALAGPRLSVGKLRASRWRRASRPSRRRSRSRLSWTTTPTRCRPGGRAWRRARGATWASSARGGGVRARKPWSWGTFPLVPAGCQAEGLSTGPTSGEARLYGVETQGRSPVQASSVERSVKVGVVRASSGARSPERTSSASKSRSTGRIFTRIVTRSGRDPTNV